MRFLGLVILAAGLAALVFPHEIGAWAASVRPLGVNPALYWARLLHEWSWPTALAGILLFAMGAAASGRRRRRIRQSRRRDRLWDTATPPLAPNHRCRVVRLAPDVGTKRTTTAAS